MKTEKQIHKRFETLPDEEKVAFLMNQIGRKPNDEVSLVELFENTLEFEQSDYGVILDFADRFRKAHPTKYDNEYEFVELKLTEHAFDTMNKELIARCLDVIARNPVSGIETVTMVTLYRLIYHGMYKEALAYSQTVWEPIANDDSLWGHSELPFIMTIFLDGVERQYEKLCQNDASGWQDFFKAMAGYGFEHEKKRIDTIYDALTKDIDAQLLIQSIGKDPEYGFITLKYHFMRFMKDKYNVSFMHADLMMDLLRSKKLLKYGKQPGAFLYVPHKALEKHITENIDAFLGFNHIEIFGKVWGLHYVYEFLFENGMIDQKHYDKMLATLSILKRDFLTMLGTHAWKGKFVLSWPKSKANTLDINSGFFDSVSTTQEPGFGDFLRLITEGDNDQDGTIDIWDDDALDETEVEWDDVDDDLDIADDEWEDEWGDKWGDVLDDDALDETGEEWEREAPNSDAEKNRGTLISGNGPYIAGDKTGRNEPCPCGSGKKYKKCCHKTK